VALQEGQGDRAVQAGEDGLGARPVGIQQGAELVGGRGLGRDVVVAQPCQGLQVQGGGGQGPEPVQPVTVGAQQVGQLPAVTWIGLGPGCAPAGSGGVEGVGMHRHHRVAGGQQPVHDHTVGGLDRHRQLLRMAVAGQPTDGPVQADLVMTQRPAVDDLAGVVHHGDVVGFAGPVPAHLHAASSSPDDVCVAGRW
jgi:hypothetical protein